MNSKEFEQTLVLIKPDALKNSVTGFLLSQLSEYHTGSRFAATKIVHVNNILAEEHYAEHQGKPFFPALIEYITGCVHYPDDAGKRRVIAIIYQGPQALTRIRAIAGPTNPHVARDEKPGCIRSLGTVVPIRDETGAEISTRLDNLIHASANAADAEREIKLWFKPTDVPPLMRAYPTQVCDEHYYLKNGEICDTFEPGNICLIAPGDVVWTSDLEALQLLRQNKPAPCSLNTVIAKYLINRDQTSS